MGGASLLKILLVEDEPLIALTLVDMLEELGRRPLEALNGDQALTLFGEHDDIDLVITDVGLPDVSGHDLAETMRTGSRPADHLRHRAHRPGAAADHSGPPTAHLGKPFQVAELESTIDRLMAVAARA